MFLYNKRGKKGQERNNKILQTSLAIFLDMLFQTSIIIWCLSLLFSPAFLYSEFFGFLSIKENPPKKSTHS